MIFPPMDIHFTLNFTILMDAAKRAPREQNSDDFSEQRFSDGWGDSQVQTSSHMCDR